MASAQDRAKHASQYWGAIERVTLAGGNTQDVWAAINAQAEAMGMESAGVNASDIAPLRTQAVRNREALARLERNAPGDLITGQMIGTAPWARDLGQQNLTPTYSVRFEHTTVSNGVETTTWRTSLFKEGTLPQTREELEAALNGDAEQMARGYGVGHVSIGSYSIAAI